MHAQDVSYDAAIAVDGVKKVFKKRSGPFYSRVSEEWALKGISFRVQRGGETYGLLGPNGSGKSTLIRVLSTLLVPDAGQVSLLGKTLPQDEWWIRRHIGRVSVDAAFYKKLSTRENLNYAALMHGIEPREAERRAMAILEGLGLMAAVLPLMSPEKGEQATNIFQSILLLISGVYYPVAVLPGWLQPLAAVSPATYTLTACRKLMGIEGAAPGADHLVGAPLSAVLPELGILLLMGVILIPLGLLVFGAAERWTKRTGKLKRTG